MTLTITSGSTGATVILRGSEVVYRSRLRRDSSRLGHASCSEWRDPDTLPMRQMLGGTTCVESVTSPGSRAGIGAVEYADVGHVSRQSLPERDLSIAGEKMVAHSADRSS